MKKIKKILVDIRDFILVTAFLVVVGAVIYAGWWLEHVRIII